MTIEEAIKRAEDTAIGADELCKRYDRASGYSRSHDETIRTNDAKMFEKSAQEHRQLAEWLKDYKRLLESSSEIPTGSIVKNDLGVREFEEIVVEYPPEDLCTYPEYKGKPYFSIKYKEGNDCFIGYGTYKPKVFSRYLRDYFMPSVTPIRPKGHWIKKGDRGFGYSDIVICKCSECGEQKEFVGKFDGRNNVIDAERADNYCSNCGADMREVEE